MMKITAISKLVLNARHAITIAICHRDKLFCGDHWGSIGAWANLQKQLLGPLGETTTNFAMFWIPSGGRYHHTLYAVWEMLTGIGTKNTLITHFPERQNFRTCFFSNIHFLFS